MGTEIKRKPREAPIALEEGDNRRFTMHTMTLFNLEEINTNDPIEVAKRSNEYFEICALNDMKPSIAEYALALGVDRKTLFRWKTGVTPKPEGVLKVINRYYAAINALMENYMQNGKINPVSGIFLMKNNMDYKDKTELSVEPKMQTEESLETVREAARLLPD